MNPNKVLLQYKDFPHLYVERETFDPEWLRNTEYNMVPLEQATAFDLNDEFDAEEVKDLQLKSNFNLIPTL